MGPSAVYTRLFMTKPKETPKFKNATNLNNAFNVQWY